MGTAAPGDALTWSDLTDAGPVDSDSDPWAWAGQDPDDHRRIDVSGVYVTAVLVTFDAARWLPATLAALGALERRPDRLIAIDNDSADATVELLEQARADGILDATYAGKPTYGFGQAVRSALRQDRRPLDPAYANTAEHGADEDDHHWLWLLHDDAAPAPDALYQLLRHVSSDRRIDITGPKLLLPKRRHGGQPLSEIGVSISGTGRRELGFEPGEIDQGQRDLPQRRLGVSTCAMLVKTSVWHDLDGLDPALPVFRDGVEFGWRAHLNGYRVMTTPQAEVTHRQVGRAGLRPRGLTGRRPGQVDRLMGMVAVAGHAPGHTLPLVWLRLVWSCLVHTVGYLLGKVPGRAADELLALGSFMAHAGRIRGLRRRTAGIDPAPGTAEAVHALRPPWWGSLRVAVDALGGAVAERYRSVAGEADAASLDELTAEEFSSVADERPRAGWLSPIVITVVLAGVASLVAARGLLGSGSLTGPALLPAPGTLGAAWHAALDPVAGAPFQSSPPWLTLVALSSTVFGGHPDWFVTALICGVVPVSLLAAYPVIRRMIVDRRVRWWAAVTYALVPVLLGGTNQGRLTLSVMAISLPLLAMAARALVLRRIRTPEAWRGGWGAGVVLLAMVAFEPSMIIVVLVAGGLAAVVLRRTPRKVGRVAIAVALPVVGLLPWWPSIVTAPGRLFVGPDAALNQTPPAPAVWSLLLGRGLGAGLPPSWVGYLLFGTVWVLALAGLARSAHRRAVLAAWVTALLAFALAVATSRLVVSVPPTGTEARPWPGAYLLLGFGALIFAAGVGLDGLSAALARRSFSWLQPASVVAGLAVGAVSVVGAGWWVWGGARGPIARVGLDAIPSYVLDAAAGPNRPRVLALDLTGAPRYSVISDEQVRLGAADRGYSFGGSVAARDEARDLVVRLAAGTADADIARQLSELGIGYLWVSGADEESRAKIGNTPGLSAASGNLAGTVWTVKPDVSRVAITTDAGEIGLPALPATVPAGPPGRLVRLGEAADPRWRATLDGRPLTAVDDGWQQTYALPAEGGTLAASIQTLHPWYVLAQGLLLLVAAVLAAPGVRRPEVRDPTKSARRAATLSEVS